MSEPYGLIFDVDGVIADTEAVNAAASIRVFADLFGVQNVERKDFEAGLGRGAAAYVRAAASAHGLALNDEQIEEATKLRQEHFLTALQERPLPAFPGVLKLMDAALGRDDFRVAIATSSTRVKSEAVLRSARVPYAQMVYVTGSEVTHKKPHPELFQTASSRMAMSSSRCVVIEDAPNGIEAAHAAGCACIAVTNSAPAGKLAKADQVVSSLAEVEIEGIAALV